MESVAVDSKALALPGVFGTLSASAVTPASEFAPGVVLVGVPAGVRRGVAALIDAALQQVGGVQAELLYTTQSDDVFARGDAVSQTIVYRVTLPAGADVPAAVRALMDGGVSFAEPDYLARAIPVESAHAIGDKDLGIAAMPNDPLYGGQWGLTKIKAAAAWDVVTGTPGAVIAFIDSGIDLAHPDLSSRLWVNPGEIADNGIDDDNNGYVDDVHGWNFVGKNNDVADDNGHGTQVAGVAAAAGNDGVGIAGVCWNCRIMVVKAMQPSGVANYSDVAAAVNYAVAKGARVINLSLGGYADSNALRVAIQAAAGSAVIVAGAGNDATSNRFYPAAYENVLGVAAMTRSDVKASSSNYGEWVSLTAPGEAITTKYADAGYGVGSGTSMAAPFVAGLAALIRSQRGAWPPALVRLQLLQTARALSAGGLGRGLPDASKAVLDPTPLLRVSGFTIDGDANGRPDLNNTVQLVLSLSNQWRDATGVVATLSTTSPVVAVGTASVNVGDILSGETKATGPLTLTLQNAAYSQFIPLTVRLTANDGAYVVDASITVTTRSSEEPVCGSIVEEVNPSQTELTWTNDKTYLATCDISVPMGYTLTIQPGTQVKFSGNYMLEISGTLIAEGTAEVPIRFENTAPKVTAVSTGGAHTCMLMETGEVECVGHNDRGQLGSVEASSYSTKPVLVAGISDAVMLDSGTWHTCVVTRGGAVKCWGSNEYGQLGSGTDNDSPTPVDVQGLDNGVSQVSSNFGNTCVVTNLGVVKCWGLNVSGQLGDGTLNWSKVPVDVAGLNYGAVTVATGGGHTCALTSTGAVKCWGWNQDGQLGVYPITYMLPVVDVTSVGSGNQDVGGLGNTTCVLTIAHRVKCWGWNIYGQLGEGAQTDTSVMPVEISGLTGTVTSMSIGWAHACVLTSLNKVQCWGLNDKGQLGNGTTMNSRTPVQVVGLRGKVIALSSSGDYTCALMNGGRVSCWGSNRYGQLGDSTQTDSLVPVDAIALGGWKGLVFRDSAMDAHVLGDGTYLGGSTLRHVVIRGAENAIECTQAVPYLTYVTSDGSIQCTVPTSRTLWLSESDLSGAVSVDGQAIVTSSRVADSLSVTGMASVFGTTANSISVGMYATIRNVTITSGMLTAGDHADVMNAIVHQGGIRVGSGSTIAGSTVDSAGILVGDHAVVDRNTVTDGGISVGRNARVSNNTSMFAAGTALAAGENVTVVGNRFLNSRIGVMASTGLISGNLIANNTETGLRIGAASVVSNTFTGNRDKSILVQDDVPILISGNNLDDDTNGANLYVDVTSDRLIPAHHNWWGVTDTLEIHARIFDKSDDWTKAAATMNPIMESPAQGAPTYVRRVKVQPDDIIGIQTAVIDVEFSKPIFADALPSLVAAGPKNFTLSSPRLVSGTHAVFDAEISTHWPRAVYSLVISGAVGEDGIEIAPNQNYSFTVDYAGSISDQTPPDTPQVTALGDGSLTRLLLRWMTSDEESGVTHYRYAVGTTQGGTDVVNWTTIEAPASRTAANEFVLERTGLNLIRGQTYYVSARARNAGGLWSEAGISDGLAGGSMTTTPSPTVAPSPTTFPSRTPLPSPTTATPSPMHTATALPSATPTPHATSTQSGPQPTATSTSNKIMISSAMHAADLGCWENEPNDNSLQASGPLLADRSCLGRSTNGVISSPVGGAYKDYFRFYKLTAGRTRIRLEFAGEDAQLQIYREGAIGTRLNLDPFVHAVELNLSPDWYYVYVNFPAHSPDMVYVVTLQ